MLIIAICSKSYYYIIIALMEKTFQRDLDYANLDIKLKKPQPSYFGTKTKGGLLRLSILIAIVVIGVILVISLFSKSRLLSQLQTELVNQEMTAKRTRDERKNIADELKALKEENKQLSRSITELSQTKSELTSTLSTLERENESLASDLIGYSQDVILSQKELDDLTEKNLDLTSEIEKLIILNENIARQIENQKPRRPYNNQVRTDVYDIVE